MTDESDDWLYRSDMRPRRATPPPRRIITARTVFAESRFIVPFMIFCFLLGSWEIVNNGPDGIAGPLLLGLGLGALLGFLRRWARLARSAKRE
jgi:hypothetical protein